MQDQNAAPKDPNDLGAYNLDSYDEEPSKGIAAGPFSNIQGLQYYANPDEDPYITLKGVRAISASD